MFKSSWHYQATPHQWAATAPRPPNPGVPTGMRRPYDEIPSAGGGGWVTTGPFKVYLTVPAFIISLFFPFVYVLTRLNMIVSLGPKSNVVNNIPKNSQSDGTSSSPRCLRRDVNKFSTAGATANYTLSLIQEYKDIGNFHNRYLGQPPLKNDPHQPPQPPL